MKCFLPKPSPLLFAIFISSLASLVFAVGALSIFNDKGNTQTAVAVHTYVIEGENGDFTGRYGIIFKETISSERGRAIIEGYGSEIYYELPRIHVFVTQIDDASRKILEQHSDVKWVIPEIVRTSSAFTLKGYFLLAQTAGEGTTPRSPDAPVPVYIIDSGAAPNIPYAGTSSIFPGVDPKDLEGHGTKVANTFMDTLKSRDTSMIELYSIKDTDDNGKGTNFTVADAIMKAVDQDARVINVSSKSFVKMDDFTKAVYDYAQAKRSIIVTAAGNDGDKGVMHQNCMHPVVLCVGALNKDGLPADYSDGLTSEHKKAGTVFANGITSSGAPGSSFAAPRVSAIIAKMIQRPVDPTYDKNGDGEWDVDEIKKRLSNGIKSGEFSSLRLSTDFATRKTDLEKFFDEFSDAEPDASMKLQALNPIEPIVKQQSGLVPCTDNCGFNDLIELVQEVINFLIVIIGIPLATVLFSYAGWLYMSAGGDPGKVAQGHKIFWNVVIGLIIALAAWLIVNTIANALLKKNEFKDFLFLKQTSVIEHKALGVRH